MTDRSSDQGQPPTGASFDQRLDAEVYDRYLTDQGTAQDLTAIDRWATTEWRRHLLEARHEAHGVPHDRTERALLLLRKRLGFGESAVRYGTGARSENLGKWRPASRQRLNSQTLRGWKWPAGIAALLTLIAAFLTAHSSQPTGVTHTYVTAVGQRATLLLDDGTHVTMSPRTTLQLVGFNRRSRTVVLDGDAYFEVAPSADAPFIVHAGVTTTRVLGTAFAVRHYARDKEVRVAVASGKVLVSSHAHHPAMAVTAGHVAIVTDSLQMVKDVGNIDTEIGWLGDRLVFQDAPLSKVLETLTRWYGYEFRCTDSTVVRQTVTIGLSIRSSTEALATLEHLLDVNLTIVGDTVTLKPALGGTTPNHHSKHYDVWVPTREVGR